MAEMLKELTKVAERPNMKGHYAKTVQPNVGLRRSDTFPLENRAAWEAHYAEQGYVIVSGVLSDAVVAEAKQGCAALVEALAQRLLAKGAVADTCEGSPFETRLMDLCRGCPEELPNLFRAELHREEFHALLCDPTLLDVVGALLPEAQATRIYPNYSARPKTPSAVHAVVWHQDAGLRSDGGPSTAPEAERLENFGVGKVVNVWTPLVPARVGNGCMKVVPKSHELGLLEHALVSCYSMGAAGLGGGAIPDSIDGFKADEETAVPVGSYMTAIKPEIMAQVEPGAVSVELDPGSVLLFNNILVHRGGENVSDHIRWSLDFRFQDAAKSTCRSWHGHVVKGPGAVASAADWASRKLE
jgi:ectoine hydroxylase-related dioxygenase (phytanoyl-CoA dioxygenase family)